jgi:sigma-B regulation protein RsbU (phosphoserine phosphatase)
LPEEIKESAGFSISSFIQPAKFVAGDLYDIFIINDEKIGVFIGDVSGKGVPAALIMSQTISLFRIFSRQYLRCPEVLNRLNKELYGKFAGRFVTCLYMVAEPSQQRVRVCSAGQSPLLLLKSSGNILEVELSAELPLGIAEDTAYQEVIFDIEEGDKIVVFTDGLLEARNRENQELGFANLKNIILKNSSLTPQELLETIKTEVFKFSAHTPQHDDITLIVLGKK